MSRYKKIKKYANEISFRLLATNKSQDQSWLEEKLHELCNSIDFENSKNLENKSESQENTQNYMGNN